MHLNPRIFELYLQALPRNARLVSLFLDSHTGFVHLEKPWDFSEIPLKWVNVSVIVLLRKIARRCFSAWTQHVAMYIGISTQFVTELKAHQVEKEGGMDKGCGMKSRPDGWACTRGERGEEEVQWSRSTEGETSFRTAGHACHIWSPQRPALASHVKMGCTLNTVWMW